MDSEERTEGRPAPAVHLEVWVVWGVWWIILGLGFLTGISGRATIYGEWGLAKYCWIAFAPLSFYLGTQLERMKRFWFQEEEADGHDQSGAGIANHDESEVRWLIELLREKRIITEADLDATQQSKSRSVSASS